MLVGNGEKPPNEQNTTEGTMDKKTFCFLAQFSIYYSGDSVDLESYQLFKLRCEEGEVDSLRDHAFEQYMRGVFTEAVQHPYTPHKFYSASDSDNTVTLEGFEPIDESTYDDISLLSRAEYDIDDVRRAMLERSSDG